jgi:hypothetical protein
MVTDGMSNCPTCGGSLKHYDRVKRFIRTKGGIKYEYRIRRLRCVVCNKLHRELPEFIFPYKQYEAHIILGVLEGLITPETIGFEDYPCEITMIRWTQK